MGESDRAISHPDEPLRVFINYRRDDTPGHAGRLYDAMVAHFGDEHVFMDVDKIEPGADFKQVINEGVGTCDVLIAVIGSHWLELRDSEGQRRLDNPNDYVRLEIEAALRRDVRVIPTLVESAKMPDAKDLPPDLAALATRNSVELGDGGRWRHDVERLIAALERSAYARRAETRATTQSAAGDPSTVGQALGATKPLIREDHREPESRLPHRSLVQIIGAHRRRWLVLLLALVAAAAIITAVVVRSGGSHGRAGATGADQMGMPSGPKGFPDAIEDELLLAHVPTSIRSTCRRVPPAAAAVFLRSVQCKQMPSSAIVTYSRAHSGDALRAYLLDRVKMAGVTFPTRSTCQTRRPSADEWSRQGIQTHVEGPSSQGEGRVACYVNGSTSWIVWTDTPTKIFASASRPTRSWPAFYAWWRASAGPEKELGMMHATASRPFPDAIEKELLLDHIPPAIRKTCRRATSFEHDVFLRGVKCSQGANAFSVTYLYPHSGTAMKAYSDNQITAAGLDFPTSEGCAKASAAADTWVRSGDIAHIERHFTRSAQGRVLCYLGADSAIIEWTDTATGIYAVASRPIADRKALYDWWTMRAGPGPLEMSMSGSMG